MPKMKKFIVICFTVLCLISCNKTDKTREPAADAPEMAAEQNPPEVTETEEYREPPIPVNEVNDPVTGIEYFEKIQWIGMHDHPDVKYAQKLRFRFNCPPIDSFMKMLWSGTSGKGEFWMEGRRGDDYLNKDFEKEEKSLFKSYLRILKRISDGKSFDDKDPATWFGEFNISGDDTHEPYYYLKSGDTRTGLYHYIYLSDYWLSDKYRTLFYEQGSHFITYSVGEKAFIPERAFGRIYRQDKFFANDDFKVVVKSTAPLKELVVLKAPRYSIPFIPVESTLEEGGRLSERINKKSIIVKRELEDGDEIEIIGEYDFYNVIELREAWSERNGEFGIWIKTKVRPEGGQWITGWVWSKDVDIGEYSVRKETWNGKGYFTVAYLKEILRYSYEKEEDGAIVFEAMPEKDYIIADINDDRVRVRSAPNLDSETLGYVNKGDEVKLYERGNEKQQIENMAAYWYRVKTAEDQEGWVYGAFLE